MATKTIIIASIKDNNGWINVTDNNNVEFGINKEKSPKLAAQLATAKPGMEITGNHTDKNGKNFLWDPNEQKSGNGGGGKNYTPKDKSFEAAQTATLAAAQAFALDKEKTTEKLEAMAECFHKFIMSKVTK